MNDCQINGKILKPIEYKVLVKPDLIEETDPVIKSAKAMGLEIPESAKAKDKMRQISGTLLAAGGKAFEDFGQPCPKIGSTVYFAKYAGLVIEADGMVEFRLMNDKDVTAILI